MVRPTQPQFLIPGSRGMELSGMEHSHAPPTCNSTDIPLTEKIAVWFCLSSAGRAGEICKMYYLIPDP